MKYNTLQICSFLSVFLPLTAVVLCLDGCGKAPVEQVSAAELALDSLHAAGAEEYTPQAYAVLTHSFDSAISALRAEESKRPLLRRYNHVKTTFIDVESQAYGLISQVRRVKSEKEAELLRVWRVKSDKEAELLREALKSARRIAVVLDDTGQPAYEGTSRQHPIAETFCFDQGKAEAGTIGGIIVSAEGIPVPIRLFGFSSAFTGSMSAVYANTIVTILGIKELNLGVVVSAEGKRLGDVRIAPGTSTDVHISPDYVVYPGDVRATQRGGPFVTLRFTTHSDEVAAAGTRLTLKRNGKDLPAIDIASEGVAVVPLSAVQRKGDVIEWAVLVEDRVMHKGVLGCPVLGSVKDVVFYDIATDGWKSE